jgi:hypothetical protein
VLLREVPCHQEPHEHREDDAADHGRKQLRARQPGPLIQRVQHAAILGAGRAKHKARRGAMPDRTASWRCAGKGCYLFFLRALHSKYFDLLQVLLEPFRR